MKKQKRIYLLMSGINISKSGYGGVNRQGTIVDRREFPEAVAIRKNSIFGTPSPKTVVKCTECNWTGGQEDLMAIPTKNGGEEECCPNCKTNEFIIELPIV